ncbi:carboxypeptidase-like regulatory domain-containing protein [Longimicrobium sp.]|uniref:carboxypeptidase-like regulatory domain-containing protein n=1 Tax=Longimicrobium sp. TaxID=2029185 RepID=UPI002E32E01F|nr:carboxypeptidase-like regulatory domain-containing protein [Longimicrobium sp.]HEX6037803.1 carboxypeptidase-like regulatory domain-containing protein [Longimicrobium sp.]
MRPIRIPRHLATSLGAMLFISCSNPEWVCGCSPAEVSAVLYGRVTDPSGTAVPGATVVTEARYGGCGSSVTSGTGYVQTDADGRYRLMMHTPAPPRAEDCLLAFARAPQGSTLAGSDTVPFTVRFGNSASWDSAAVNLVLR